MAVHSDYHAVGVHEILDGRAFLQEFGVRGHVERYLAAAFVYLFPDHGLDLLRRTDGYGAFGDEHRIFLDVAAERTGDFEHVFQVCRTVLVGRCADGREDYFHLVQAVRQLGREVQAPLLDIAFDEFFEPRLVNRDEAVVQGVDLFPVDVDARNIEPHFCETGTRYEADITRTHDCDFHHIMSKFLVGLAVHAPGDPRCERVACLVPCRRETLLHFHGFADRLPLHLLCEFAQAAYGG